MSFSFKFLPVKDLIFSVIPTIGTYLGYLQGVTPDLLANKYVAIGVGLVASIILAFVFYKENVKSYKRSLAEILATGYVMNFTERMGRLLQSKLPYKILIDDLEGQPISPDNIYVEIAIPKSMQALKDYANTVDEETTTVFLEDPSSGQPIWLRGKLEKDDLYIYDFPRTLFALRNYLKADFSNPKKEAKRSKKIFAYFSDKVDELREERISDFLSNRINFKTI
ncbi:MAG: hypothetical protein KJO49_06590 [Bacteroidia bacterium]|nr:hypothetical protein [Bacteroidia bacterium]MBT8267612.1 hypothetical protein [Bacteroidia bacterium]NNK71012.1 hypothetical protein [Flavobacteriaceae bacterium]NNL80003.1 hypothetical protein [Flavobacteriaceae bacterium]